MSNLIAIFIGMALINNIILSQFLGLCPFLGVSKKLSNAISMAMAVFLVMVVASIVTWILYNLILVPYDITFMMIVVYILVIASLVQIIEMIIKRTNITLYNALGIYLPLITTNCAVLGITVINSNEAYSLIEAIVASVGAGLGFALVLIMMSGIREKLDLSPIPKSLKGAPIAFIVAMFLSLAFIGFGGLV